MAEADADAPKEEGMYLLQDTHSVSPVLSLARYALPSRTPRPSPSTSQRHRRGSGERGQAAEGEAMGRRVDLAWHSGTIAI